MQSLLEQMWFCVPFLSTKQKYTFESRYTLAAFFIYLGGNHYEQKGNRHQQVARQH